MTSPSNLRVFISPSFGDKEDKGDGGVRRVVEAQERYLPEFGVDVVRTPQEADVLALHMGNWLNPDEIANKPIVAHCHGLYWDGYEWDKWSLALNKDVIRTMRQADVVTAPSKWVADSLKRGMWIDAIPVYHGIHTEDWPYIVDDPDQYVLWNKNRPDPICDPVPVSELARLAPDTQFMSTFVEGMAPDNVIVTGKLPYEDAKRAVRYAGVYLATSRETFGIGTLEAMAAGVPILGWNWGGQAEFVKHQEHGYLATPGDYTDLLAGLRYCQDNRERLGLAAREHVLYQFNWRVWAHQYADIYKDLHAEHVARPKVSIVIPYHNLAAYVTDTLKSVAAQTFKDFECVIVDDKSDEPVPPEAARIIVSDPRFRWVHNRENLYLSETLNVGIRTSSGQFILPLDADNMIAPNTLEVLVGEILKDPSLDIAYGRVQFLKDDGTSFISDWPPPAADPGEQLRHRNQVPSTALYRRRTWERVGGYRRRCHTAEDADFWSRALTTGARGRRVTDAITLIYRDRSDSMSHQQKDWDWNYWYGYASNPDLRLYGAGGARIPTYEFPRISVIIPVGPGHERYVLDALDSLQNQAITEWEAIVVNDTGDPLKDLPSWAKVFSFWRHPDMGGGAAAARNYGLKHAKGEFVTFLDADDYLHPRALRDMRAALEAQGPGNFVCPDWFKAEDGTVHPEKNYDPNDVLRQLHFPVTSMYYRADLEKNGIQFDESFNGKGWEDWDFALQVVAQHGICGHRLKLPLLHYRMRSGTLREKAFANSDAMKNEIYAKWADYISGKKENMGCGGCGYRGPSNSYGPQAPTTQADPSAGETATLEFLAEDPNISRRFTGRATGTGYRFGTEDDEHRRRKVFLPDVAALLSTGLFKRVDTPTPFSGDDTFVPMRADGPPRAAVVGTTTRIPDDLMPAVIFEGGAALASGKDVSAHVDTGDDTPAPVSANDLPPVANVAAGVPNADAFADLEVRR